MRTRTFKAIPVRHSTGHYHGGFEEMETKEHSGNKYLRTLTSSVTGNPKHSLLVDVYDVLVAFNITCPATAHAIKKLLCAGLRNKGSAKQDLTEAIDAIKRAVELLPPEPEVKRTAWTVEVDLTTPSPNRAWEEAFAERITKHVSEHLIKTSEQILEEVAAGLSEEPAKVKTDPKDPVGKDETPRPWYSYGEWEVVPVHEDDEPVTLKSIIGYKVRWSTPDEEGRYLWVGHYHAGDKDASGKREPSLGWCNHAAQRHAARLTTEGKTAGVMTSLESTLGVE